MRRILLSVCLLIVVAACARIEQRAAERATVAVGAAPVSTSPVLLTPLPTPSLAPVITQFATPTLEPTLIAPQPTALPVPTEIAAPVDFVKTVHVDGAARTFRLHVPPSIVPKQPVALVLDFHGYGSIAAMEESLSELSKKADAENFIVAYPEGTQAVQRWGIVAQGNGRADLAFVRAMLALLKNEYPIDPSRIYATGFSNGAEFTNLLACNMGDDFAAVAMVAGGYFRGLPCAPKRPVPLVAFHGTFDNVLPYIGDDTGLLPVRDAMGEWAARNGCDATPMLIFQNGNVTGEQWGDCRENADVVLFTVDRGGHSWPGSPAMPGALTTRDVIATDMLWLFFVTHPKP